MNDDLQTQTPSSPPDASKIQSVAADVRSAATQKFGEAVTEVRAQADSVKSGMADEVQDVAMALRRASEELRGGSAQERTLGTIASSLADVSDSLRDKDLGDIVQMVSKVARDNPVLFLGGAALLGFAASRFAKASGNGMYASGSQGMGYKSAPDLRTEVDTFVDEGNPNTHPVYPAS